jgi:hypothetical protein
MANTLATPDWVTKEVGRGFVNGITFVKNVTRTYDDQYVISGAKVGDTVKARLPQRFTVTDGAAFQPQALYDSTVPISLTNQKNVAFSDTSWERTTSLDEMRKRYVDPAAQRLAEAADKLAFANVYADVYNSIGTPGSGGPTTPFEYLEAGVKLTDGACPKKGRVAVLDQYQMAVIANATNTLFHPSATITENYEKGQFARMQLGIEKWLQDPSRPTHSTGTFTASTPVVNGASQTGSSLVTSGWASGASSLAKGDIFTLAGVY